jgi:hypothetical protein
MSPLKMFNATTLILTAAGLALIGILTLEARPTSLPAGSASSGASSGQSIVGASTTNSSAANNSAGRPLSIGRKPRST